MPHDTPREPANCAWSARQQGAGRSRLWLVNICRTRVAVEHWKLGRRCMDPEDAFAAEWQGKWDEY
jgi:hypothetical protein